MEYHRITIQTQATGRQIRQAMQALLKSQAITSGHKIPYIKYFSFDENMKTVTKNTNLLIVQITEKREKIGPKILDQILLSWSESDILG